MDPVIETINTYNNFADEYRQRYYNNSDGKKMESQFMNKFVDYLETGKLVLDIGTGTGFDSKNLIEKGCSVTGIDMADKLLEVAREVAPLAKLLKMDMRKMTFTDASYNGVWAADSILHLPKKEIGAVIADIYRILNDNGILFLGLKQGIGEEFKLNKGEGNLNGARRFFAYYSREEVELVLKNGGFKILEYIETENRGNIWMNFFCKKIKNI